MVNQLPNWRDSLNCYSDTKNSIAFYQKVSTTFFVSILLKKTFLNIWLLVKCFEQNFLKSDCFSFLSKQKYSFVNKPVLTGEMFFIFLKKNSNHLELYWNFFWTSVFEIKGFSSWWNCFAYCLPIELSGFV